MRQKLVKVLFYGTWLIRFSFLTTLFIIVTLPLRFSKKYKDLWIIGERPEEARDNGYWLYKWILENKPETNVRFVLKKSSVDYDKMPRKDLIIEPGSAKHYIYWILSSYSVSTHMHGACPGKSFCIPFLPFARKKTTVFLQHGVTKDMINMRGGLDIITAVSKEEKDLLIKANPRYKDNVYITGFCRYDRLKDLSKNKKEKMILVMPTFRKWLRDIGRLNDADGVFKKTDYFKAWNSFLNDENLINKLEENNIKLIFFPHNEMQKLAHNFESNSKNIVIGKPGEFDIQTLLKEASILVTDYSSVLFDFVYMNKPIALYQFDQKEFFNGHYKSSGKQYPFGDVLSRKDDLISEVIETIDRGYSLKAEYSDDAKTFFVYRDDGNCNRVYALIKSGFVDDDRAVEKTIHYIWFGNNPLPESAKKCIDSWKKYMPDYKIIEWNEKNFDISSNKYMKEAYDNKQYAFASDYARLKILYDNGGIYFDTDVELIRPVPDHLIRTGFLAKENKKRIATGLGFACKKHDETIRRMLDDYEKISFVRGDGSFDKTPCPKRNTRALGRKTYSHIAILESDYMNPQNNKTGNLKITSNTFSIHHYSASWLTNEEKERKERRYKDVQKYGETLGLLKYRIGRIPSKIRGKR